MHWVLVASTKILSSDKIQYTRGKKNKHRSTSYLKVRLGPAGGAVPPRAAGGCGDAFGGGGDEPGHGGRRPRRLVEAAVQRRYGTQQRGG